MAIETVNQDPASANDPVQLETSASRTSDEALTARAYIDWLHDIERASGLPNGARAYLVSIDHDGVRRLRPIESGKSVLDLRTELKAHLSDIGYTREFFSDLRDFCSQRLGERSVSPARCHLALQASWEIEAAAGIVLQCMEPVASDQPLRTLLRRIRKLAEAQMSAIEDPDVPDADIQEIIAV